MQFFEDNLVTLLRRRAVEQPQAIAYTFLADGEREESHLTYGDLDQRARVIAARLQQEMAAGERAILLYPTGLDFVAAFFGCLYAGVVAVPVPEPFLERHILRLRNIVGDAQTRTILTDEKLLAMVQHRFGDNAEIQALRWLATDSRTAEAGPWHDPEIGPDTLAFLQYTSGSTAAPKGVLVSHRNVMANSEMIRRFLGSSKESVFVTWLPLFHDLGLIANIVQTVYAGGRCVLMPPFVFLQKPFRWLQAISRYRADISGAPDFAYALAARKVTAEQKAGLDLSRWRKAYNGAEPVRATSLESFADAFHSCGFRRESLTPAYGMAEAVLFMTGDPGPAGPIYYDVDADAFGWGRIVPARDGESKVTTVACGRTDWLDQEIKIVNPDSCLICAPDEVGEIWISGSHVTAGYWKNPAETEAVFHGYLADSNEGPFLRSGDLGFMHQGRLYIGGRIKDLIIIDGTNHYPQDIEFTVENAHPLVRPGCTAAFSIDRNGQERLVIVAELRPHDPAGEPLSPDQLRHEIRQAVAAEHGIRSHDIQFIKPRTIPKTSSGKIQRRACRADYLSGRLDRIDSELLVTGA
jgi:acyl-CoA synthetase (AMP-forming)/AMP-acid ligase II